MTALEALEKQIAENNARFASRTMDEDIGRTLQREITARLAPVVAKLEKVAARTKEVTDDVRARDRGRGPAAASRTRDETPNPLAEHALRLQTLTKIAGSGVSQEW